MVTNYPALTPTTVRLPCADGDVTGLDFGGSGPLVLLLHDRLENAAHWATVGTALAAFSRPVALDAPGHGRTPLGEPAAARTPARWRRLRQAVDLLGMGRPLVVGQGLGGLDAAAATAAGQLDPRALVLLEGVLPGTPEASVAYLAQFDDDVIVDGLIARFGLGRRAGSLAEIDAVVAEVLQDARRDWLLRDQDPVAVAAQVRRGFAPVDGGWVRRPVPAVVRDSFRVPPVSHVPSSRLYAQVTVPMDVVAATDGVFADDPDAVYRLVAGRTDRSLRVVESTHDIAATHPDVVVDAVRRRLDPR